MKVLGKVAFVPVVATAAFAVAGAGVGLAMATSTPSPAPHSIPFTAQVIQSNSMFSSVSNGRSLALAKVGETLNCTATSTSTSVSTGQGKTYYNCKDTANGKTGWIWSAALS